MAPFVVVVPRCVLSSLLLRPAEKKENHTAAGLGVRTRETRNKN